jgi:hypothetical protein
VPGAGLGLKMFGSPGGGSLNPYALAAMQSRSVRAPHGIAAPDTPGRTRPQVMVIKGGPTVERMQYLVPRGIAATETPGPVCTSH